MTAKHLSFLLFIAGINFLGASYITNFVSDTDLRHLEGLGEKGLQDFGSSVDVARLNAALSISNLPLSDERQGKDVCDILSKMSTFPIEYIRAASMLKCKFLGTNDFKTVKKVIEIDVDLIATYSDMLKFHSGVKAAIALENSGLSETKIIVSAENLMAKLSQLFQNEKNIRMKVLAIDALSDIVSYTGSTSLKSQTKDLLINSISTTISEIDDDYTHSNSLPYVFVIGNGIVDSGRFLNAVLRLSSSLDDELSLTPELIVGLSEIVVNSKYTKSVITAEIVLSSVDALTSRNIIGSPICLQVVAKSFQVDSGTRSSTSTTGNKLKVVAVDIRGLSVSGDVMISTIVNSDDKAIGANIVLESVPGSSLSSDSGVVYEVDLLSHVTTKKTGFYTVEITMEPTSDSFISIYSFETEIIFQKLKSHIEGSNDTNLIKKLNVEVAASKNKIEYPQKVKQNLKLDGSSVVKVQIELTERVHQVFVRFSPASSSSSSQSSSGSGSGGGGAAQSDNTFGAYFCAEPKSKSSKIYSIHIDLGPAEGDVFHHQSGEYDLYVTVGDSFLETAYDWHFATATIEFMAEPLPEEFPLYRKSLLYSSDIATAALPEIHHQFRNPESRPPALLSLCFTVSLIIPFAGFIVSTRYLDMNLQHIPTGLDSVWFLLFHGSSLGIVILYVIYWLQLTIFHTFQYLFPLLAVAAVSGYYLMRSLAVHMKVSKATGDDVTRKQKAD